ncbi:OX-2 membrane glycoprotein-like, partial [Pyxicephalus adspersus]|uniref:OX-2 membrane glycoprotein-like n=1 Tax=Pyxicephalus adspersus TaxID=30357 RepID=UPI003B5B889A
WHKETGNFTGPVATYSKLYRERILGYLKNRTTQYTVDNLNLSAITISPVTLEDHGCFKCIFNVYQIGANSGTVCLDVYGSFVVITNAKQAATVGGKVTLQCHLQASHPNVFQITWQKETGNFTGPVATYSKLYRERILGYLKNRTTQYTVDNLNLSAITISPVTLEDQGCFKCIFNVYQIGANSGTVCLDVYERNISEPILEKHQVRSQDSSEKLQVVTCSATGKPAPQISWNTTAGLTITSQMYTIKNPNGTETTISNFTHKVTENRDEKVICVVSHPTLHSDIYLSTFLDDTSKLSH